MLNLFQHLILLELNTVNKLEHEIPNLVCDNVEL